MTSAPASGPDAGTAQDLGLHHVQLAVPAGAEAACRALPAPARPRRWLLLPALPLTRAGKVDREAVQRLAAGREDGPPGTRR